MVQLGWVALRWARLNGIELSKVELGLVRLFPKFKECDGLDWSWSDWDVCFFLICPCNESFRLARLPRKSLLYSKVPEYATVQGFELSTSILTVVAA
jgi:hypothetical protein